MDSLNAGMFDFYASIPWTPPLIMIGLSAVIYAIAIEGVDYVWPVVRRTPPRIILRKIGLVVLTIVALGTAGIVLAVGDGIFWVLTGIGI